MEMKQEEKLEIRYVPLSTCRYWDRNPKRHDIGGLVTSIKRYGFRDAPIFDDKLNSGEGGICAGNGRVEAVAVMKAAKEPCPRGIIESETDWLVPIQFGLSAKNELEAIAHAIDNNNMTLTGGDFTQLDMSRLWELKEYVDLNKLLAEGGEVAVTVDVDDVDYLIHLIAKQQDNHEEPPEPDMGKAGEMQEKWKVEPGQVWQLGEHRIICGDSTDPAVWECLMGKEKARLVWSDPPYGVNYGAKLDDANPMHYKVRTIENDDLPPEELEKLIRNVLINSAKYSMVGGSIYLASPVGTLLPILIDSFKGSGFIFHWCLVWIKDQLVLGHGDYHFRHEHILYGWKDDGAHYFTDDRTQDSVFEIPRPKTSEEHPTTKPVELIVCMIKNSSELRDIVIDPFAGSGSTLLACEQTKRRGRMIEIIPMYCSVILERYYQMTGIEPILL